MGRKNKGDTSLKERIKEYALLTVGTLFVVVGVYFFKFPNNFSFGGVTGIAIVSPHPDGVKLIYTNDAFFEIFRFVSIFTRD